MWKTLIGTSDPIGETETNVQPSGTKKAVKELIRSPERGCSSVWACIS